MFFPRQLHLVQVRFCLRWHTGTAEAAGTGTSSVCQLGHWPQTTNTTPTMLPIEHSFCPTQRGWGQPEEPPTSPPSPSKPGGARAGQAARTLPTPPARQLVAVHAVGGSACDRARGRGRKGRSRRVTLPPQRGNGHNAKPETGASRDTCRQSHSRHPRHTADTSDVPWAGTRTPGRRACHCHPQATSPAGSGTTGSTETLLAKLLARPQPQVMGDGKRTQSTKGRTSHPPPWLHAAAPGQRGRRHPVPALGDTTAAAPAAPAPPLGAQLRPRLPQAEVLRQLPERSHGPRHLRACARLQPWAPLPPHAHACYALATPRAPSAAGAGKESCGSGREHKAGQEPLVGPSTACFTVSP